MATPIEQLGKDAIAAKGWLAAHKWLILRRLSQALIIALFAAGPIGGVWVLKGNLAASWVFDAVPLVEPFVFLQMLAAGMFGFLSTTLIGVAIVVAFYALLGGRIYCAWVCPVNVITDTAAWARRKLGISQSAKISPQTRWWMLAAVLALALISGQLAYELVNPVSVVHRGLIFGMGAGFWAMVAGIFLFDLLVARHGWCGHVCPMGAMYSLIGAPAALKVASPNRAQCDDCMECFEVCPEPQILPAALKQGMKKGLPALVDSSLCTRCGRCIDICSKDVFTFGVGGVLLPGRAHEEGAPKGAPEEKMENFKKAS